MKCPNAATCPSAHHLDDGTWLIVGHAIPDHETRRLGGNPDHTEAGIIIPQEIIDQITKPYRDRITALETHAIFGSSDDEEPA